MPGLGPSEPPTRGAAAAPPPRHVCGRLGSFHGSPEPAPRLSLPSRQLMGARRGRGQAAAAAAPRLLAHHKKVAGSRVDAALAARSAAAVAAAAAGSLGLAPARLPTRMFSCVGCFWVLLSSCLVAVCSFSFLSPAWIVKEKGARRLVVATAAAAAAALEDEGAAEVSFGLLWHCSETLQHMYDCYTLGGLGRFSEIPSSSWQVSGRRVGSGTHLTGRPGWLAGWLAGSPSLAQKLPGATSLRPQPLERHRSATQEGSERASGWRMDWSRSSCWLCGWRGALACRVGVG